MHMTRDERPTRRQRPLNSKEPLDLGDTTFRQAAPLRRGPITPRRASGLSRRIVLIIALPVMLAVGYLAYQSFFATPDVGDLLQKVPVAQPAKSAKKRAAPPLASEQPVTLPSGLEIDRGSSQLNYDLAGWLATQPTTPRTFTFERLRFDPGSAQVYDTEKEMLQVLSQILTAYPQAKAVITANGPGQLGFERANAIRTALLQLAADPDQISATAGDSSESAPKLTVKLDLGVGSDLDA
jgi:outer membrane protein OmpA-like peptidoglycan-associated protein